MDEAYVNREKRIQKLIRKVALEEKQYIERQKLRKECRTDNESLQYYILMQKQELLKFKNFLLTDKVAKQLYGAYEDNLTRKQYLQKQYKLAGNLEKKQKLELQWKAVTQKTPEFRKLLSDYLEKHGISTDFIDKRNVKSIFPQGCFPDNMTQSWKLWKLFWRGKGLIITEDNSDFGELMQTTTNEARKALKDCGFKIVKK